MEADKDSKIRADLIINCVIVFKIESGNALYRDGFFGKPVGIRKPKSFEFDRPLELSLIESLFLMQDGRIDVYQGDQKLSIEEFTSIASKFHDNFQTKYIVYKDLRQKGYVIRPGLKFGADFAIYQHGPGIDHAPFIVHVLPNIDSISAIEMVRAGRLATSVRKKFIIATLPLPEKISYYMFTWFKP